MADRILIADDDVDVALAIQVSLELEGFEVHVIHDGDIAIAEALRLRPDLVILDVVMPGVDGYEVCRRLRSDPRLLNCPVILLSAKSLSEDVVRGFSAGADDYVIKPYDSAELSARVRAVLRRSSMMRDLSPLTRLPGNFHIARELNELVSKQARFAVIYADLNGFKSFNDHYGFLRGDEVIKFTARALTDALAAHPTEPSFVGHVGGDDFIMVVGTNEAEAICADAIEAFDAGIAALYDDEDVVHDYIEVKNRQGEVTRHRLTSLALGVASTEIRPIRSRWEASAIASEMKSQAKVAGRSTFLVDRRHE